MQEPTYKELMASSQASELDSILCAWHQWGSHSLVGRGFNKRALVCGDYLVSRQYDWDSGVLDGDLEDSTMRTVDFQVSEMKDPYRAAIYCLAQALTVGAAVFTSPRLPTDAKQRQEIVDIARDMLTVRLISAGVL